MGLEFATETATLPPDMALLANPYPSLALWRVSAAVALALGFAAAAFAEGETTQVPIPHLSPARTGVAATGNGADGGNGATTPEVPTLRSAAAARTATPAPAVDDLGSSGDDLGGSGDDLDAVPPGTTDDTGPDVGPPADIRPGSFTLEARLSADAPPLGDGVTWRVFSSTPGPDGHLELLGQADGGIVYFGLKPGTYYVHAAYGHAGATRKIEVSGQTGGEVVVLNAGGMRLMAMNGKEQPLRPGEVTFDIYAPDEAGGQERFLLLQNAPPGHVISLNAGQYHVVSKYGDANAIVRADIKVDPGKLTEATLFQKAARMTLKLVEQHGGEAIADTAWTVTTLAGGNIVQSVGAFPTVVLAAGDYTALAKHDGRTFQSNFTVEPNDDRDIEVLAQ